MSIKEVRNSSFFVLMLAITGCASLSQKIEQKIGLKSFLPESPLRVATIASVKLVKGAEMGDRSVNIDDQVNWQWRGRNALGAPPQSFIAPLFIGGDDVLVVTLGGGIGIYDLRSGTSRWKVEIPVGVASKPLIVGSSVFVAGMDGNVRKIRMDSGKVEWTSRISAESLGGVAAHQGFVYVTAGDDSLWALDEKTGQNRWTYKRPSPQGNSYWSLRGNSVPKLSPDGSRLFAGFADGYFVAMESSNGQTIWERNFDRAGRFKDADQPFEISQDGSQIYLPLVDGDLVVLKAADGASLWSLSGGGGSTPLLDEDEGFLYVASIEGALLKVSIKDAKIVWAQPLPKVYYSQPINLDKDYLALTSSEEGLLFVDRKSGKIVQKTYLGRTHLAAPTYDGARLLLLSSRNLLYSFKVTRRELRQQLAQPAAKVSAR